VPHHVHRVDLSKMKYRAPAAALLLVCLFSSLVAPAFAGTASPSQSGCCRNRKNCCPRSNAHTRTPGAWVSGSFCSPGCGRLPEFVGPSAVAPVENHAHFSFAEQSAQTNSGRERPLPSGPPAFALFGRPPPSL
jgi:hypothetical protein